MHTATRPSTHEIFVPPPEKWLGRVLVYANGHRSKILNVGCRINGVPGLILKPIDRESLSPGDTLASIKDVQTWLKLGVWHLEPLTTPHAFEIPPR